MFKEKLNKKLATALEQNGISTANELQLKSLAKINAGFDVIGVGPDGIGKTTLITIATIQKLQEAFEDPPRALILVANKEKALALHEQFNLYIAETDLRIISVFEEGKIDAQTVEIYRGCDIVIGTAKRIMEIYFKRTLNINKIKLFVIDDAESIIANAWHGQVDRLGESLPKCQHLVFTKQYTAKIEKLIHKFIVAPHIFEINPSKD
jgi:ATP-dependent RNA helicase RhlE